MHPYNLGELVLHVQGDITTPLPCTPRGVIELLDAYDIDLNGKEVCVLGRGITIGRTIGLLLTRKAINATVTCATPARATSPTTCVAPMSSSRPWGSAGFVKPENVKDGAVLMDVGVSRVFDEQTGRFPHQGETSTRPVMTRFPHTLQTPARRSDDPRHAARQRRGDGREENVAEFGRVALVFPPILGMAVGILITCVCSYECTRITEYRVIIHPLLETIYLHGREQH